MSQPLLESVRSPVYSQASNYAVDVAHNKNELKLRQQVWAGELIMKIPEAEEGRGAEDCEEEGDTFSVCESSTRVQPSRSYRASIILLQSLACSHITKHGRARNNGTSARCTTPATRCRSGTGHKTVSAP